MYYKIISLKINIKKVKLSRWFDILSFIFIRKILSTRVICLEKFNSQSAARNWKKIFAYIVNYSLHMTKKNSWRKIMTFYFQCVRIGQKNLTFVNGSNILHLELEIDTFELCNCYLCTLYACSPWSISILFFFFFYLTTSNSKHYYERIV